MTRILFASCMNNHHDSRGRVWSQAAAFQPDWLFLIGDNIYLDWGDLFARFWSAEQLAAELNERYARQFSVKTFRKLVNTIPAGQVVGTWDDHDFAFDNANGASANHDLPRKRLVARAFFHHYFEHLNTRPLPEAWTPLSFDQALASPAANLEVYRSFQLGPLLVIFTDGRFYREDRQDLGRNAQLLGQAQEAWLLNEVSTTTLLPLVISGSTMTDGSGQSWDCHEAFFERFQTALNGKPSLFMGGDVHENRLIQHSAYPIVELVSSGAGLGWINDFPSKRNFGLLDIDPQSIAIRLIRKSKVQYSATYNIPKGKIISFFDADNDDENHAPKVRQAAGHLGAARRKEGKLPKPPLKK